MSDNHQPFDDFDAFAFMVPPWVNYPHGEDDLFAFDAWWRQLSTDKRAAWKSRYEVPEKWQPLFTFRGNLASRRMG